MDKEIIIEKIDDWSVNREVLSCPFCGAFPEILPKGNDYWIKIRRPIEVKIKCSKCFVTLIVGAISESMEWCINAAIDKWNRRINNVNFT